MREGRRWERRRGGSIVTGCLLVTSMYFYVNDNENYSFHEILYKNHVQFLFYALKVVKLVTLVPRRYSTTTKRKHQNVPMTCQKT